MPVVIKSLIVDLLRKLTRPNAETAIGLAVVMALAVGACLPDGQIPEKPVAAQGPRQPVIDQVPTKVSDCFGGALAQDTLHCKVLEDAHNAGDITVAGIYVRGAQSEGRALYVFLTQDAEQWDDVIAGLQSRTRVAIGPNSCPKPEFGCTPEFQNGEDWIPTSSLYSSIRLQPGGNAAQRQLPGWASFRQLWPRVQDDTVTTRSTRSTLDVSSVAAGDIPLLDCSSRSAHKGFYSGQDCAAFKTFPDLHLAGWVDAYLDPDEIHVQVKAEPGQEDATVAATRAALREWQFYRGDDHVFIHPVKYDYGEYWRWAVILDRFIHSPGNTLGMVAVRIDYNVAGPRGTIREVSGLQNVTSGRNEPENIRISLHILTVELATTLANLPQLLAQLGIPNDAVGIVIEVVSEPSYEYEPHSTTRNLDESVEPANDSAPALNDSDTNEEGRVEIAAIDSVFATDAYDAAPVYLPAADGRQ